MNSGYINVPDFNMRILQKEIKHGNEISKREFTAQKQETRSKTKINGLKNREVEELSCLNDFSPL